MTEKETRLVEENVPLAVYTAGQWMKKAVLEWEDALSAAEYGLVKAAMSFESQIIVRAIPSQGGNEL